MNSLVLVPIKRVIDPYVKIRVKADGSGVETASVKMAMNPFDEIAVEEALRLKEAGKVDEVVLVTIGNSSCEETLRHGLALGADKGIHLLTEDSIQPLGIAKLLKKIVEEIKPMLVLMGKQSIDGDNNQTGQMLAALLNWPQGTFVSKLELENHEATVMREVDGGLETLSMALPAVITTDLRLNEPRYASLPNIMQAKNKPIEKKNASELGVDIETSITLLSVAAPTTERNIDFVENASELVEKLQKEKIL